MNDTKRSTSKNKTKDPLTLLVYLSTVSTCIIQLLRELNGQQIVHLPKIYDMNCNAIN